MREQNDTAVCSTAQWKGSLLLHQKAVQDCHLLQRQFDTCARRSGELQEKVKNVT